MKLHHRLLALILVAVFSIDTASSQSADVQARAQAAMKAVPEGFKFFYVPSSGVIADATFMATSKTKGPSAIAKQLAQAIRTSDIEHFVIAVSGPSDSKTVQVIKDALVATKKQQLPQLTLIFVGGESAGKEVEPVVTELGAKYVFAIF